MNSIIRFCVIALPIVLLIPVMTYAELNFEHGAIFGVGKRASTIDAGDFDGDGDLDLAIANIFSDSITLAYNDGNGNFTQINNLLLEGGLKHPVALAAGDLDGDGRDDLAYVNVQYIEETEAVFRGANVIFYFSEDGGTFYQFPIGILGVPSWVEINDIDGDGDNDVLVGNNGEFSITLSGITQTGAGVYPYINRGQSRFTGAQPVETFGSLIDLISFDFDSDGKMDVIGLDQGIMELDSSFNFVYKDQMLDIFKGTDEGLSPPMETPLFLTPWSLDSGDFDGDGIDDVAVTIVGDMNFTSFLGTNASVNIYRNTGSSLDALTTVPTSGIAFSVLADDYDGDGDADMAVTVQDLTGVGDTIRLDASLKFYENDGTGTMTETASFPVEEEPRYATKGDFDGDGDIDLAILCSILDSAEEQYAIEGRVYLFFNNAVTEVPSWEIY